jgi:ribosomal protein S18 acetylase RimI-like enzyme
VHYETLDNPVWASLTGTHSRLALVNGRAARYPGDVSPFMGVPDNALPEDWRQLAALAGADPVVLVNPPASLPATWSLLREIKGLQMLAPEEAHPAEPPMGDWQVDRLGPADAADMLALATATEPGPFAARTGVLGVYLGIRDQGKLIAMAGERLQPDEWIEISGVCTDPAYRGRGLARLLMELVAAGIRQRGQRPFLHVVATNAGAIRLYESMGYVIRRTVDVNAYRPTGHPSW